MINALGLLEVRGLACGIEAADAMLKAASVRLLQQTITNPGLITLMVEGNLAACAAALEAGVTVATRHNGLVSHKLIGRPDDDTAFLVSDLLKAAPLGKTKSVSIHKKRPAQASPAGKPVSNHAPASEVVAAPVPAIPLNADDAMPQGEVLLTFLAGRKQGCSASEVAARFSVSVAVAQGWLQTLVNQGRAHRRGSRYRSGDTMK